MTKTHKAKIKILEALISKSLKYSESFKSVCIYLTDDNESIIIERELINKDFPDFKTKIPVSDIDKAIVRERARLLVHETYNKSKLESI